MKPNKNKTFTVAYRRRREGKTDYKRRLKILLSDKPRMVVRKTLNSIIVQIIQYEAQGDKVLAAIDSKSLSKLGWNYNFRNIPSAYLAGAMIAKKAKEAGVEEAILDIGLHKSVPGSRLYAVLKGAVDAGLNIPHSEDVLPKEDRLTGKHIEDYAKELKKDKESFDKRFSSYLKNNADPTVISKVFKDTKKKIIGA